MEVWVYGWTAGIVFLLVVWLTSLVALLHLVRLEVDAREEGTCAPDVACLPVGLWLEVDACADNVLGYVEFLNRIGRLGFQATLNEPKPSSTTRSPLRMWRAITLTSSRRTA